MSPYMPHTASRLFFRRVAHEVREWRTACCNCPHVSVSYKITWAVQNFQEIGIQPHPVLSPCSRRKSPDEGGETVFPESENKVTGKQWSDCAKKGLAVRAVKGDAVLSYSLKPDGETDHTSLHGSCPTTAGDKWTATKWIHTGPYKPSGA